MARLRNFNGILKNKKMNFINIHDLENQIFGKNSKFKLKKKQEKELKNDFKRSRILICGAAGSIGKAFALKLKNYDMSKVIFLDKDENSLTELNREINLIYKNKIIRDFICQDINNFNIHNFLKSEKISHFFNFAALKHVRSEENFHSLNYLIKTNCISPFQLGNLNRLRNLKKIFFISTDKTVYPSSLMGCSKKVMENELFKQKRRFSKKFISTVRFANVSFSNGSLLKNIYEKTLASVPVGVPDNISRYFVTHSEGADLCLISLLKESDGCIIIPTYKSVGNSINLKELTVQIIKKLNKKPIFVEKILKQKGKIQQILLEKREIIGQKNKEFFYEKNEKLVSFRDDVRIKKIYLYKNSDSKIYSKLFKKSKTVKDIYKGFKKIFIKSSYNMNEIKKVYLKNII
jgi:FlaA1/EpsC-like NDP-sugar epimerase|tara:strand:+ start:8937 stop:10151 length:1215 start_codon:yes stop_codon:yes gene_type:complete